LPGRGRRAVLRLSGLAVPVHVRVQDGPEQLVVPDAPVLLLPEEEGPLEMRVRAPHVPGGLVARAELLITAAPVLRSLRTTTEAQLAARAAELADGAGEDLSALPAGPLRIGAGEPVLIQLDP